MATKDETIPDDESAEVTPDNEMSEGEAPNPSIIPEDFQQQVHDFLGTCTSPECLDYIATAISKKRMEIEKTSAKGDSETFDTVGMPE